MVLLYREGRYTHTRARTPTYANPTWRGEFGWVARRLFAITYVRDFHWRWSSLSTEPYDILFVYATHRTTDKSLWILTRPDSRGLNNIAPEFCYGPVHEGAREREREKHILYSSYVTQVPTGCRYLSEISSMHFTRSYCAANNFASYYRRIFKQFTTYFLLFNYFSFLYFYYIVTSGIHR